MPRGPVPVLPLEVPRQQLLQHGEQVGIAARSRLQDRHSRGGMRHEHVQQSVTLSLMGLSGDELLTPARQVEDNLLATSTDVDQLGTHTAASQAGTMFTSFGARAMTLRIPRPSSAAWTASSASASFSSSASVMSGDTSSRA